MTTITEMLKGELDAVPADAEPVSWELSREALASLRAAAHEADAPVDAGTAFGLPVIESDVPGFAVLLNTKPR